MINCHGIPTRVDVAMSVLGIGGGSPGDMIGSMGEVLRSLKGDRGDVPTATPEPRALTPDEEKVRTAALEVLRLYLTGENDYADPLPEMPMVQAMPDPAQRIAAMRAGGVAAAGARTEIMSAPALVLPDEQVWPLSNEKWNRIVDVLGMHSDQCLPVED